ncbi:EG45-like domain containing protein [Pyrus x bretschneideri]|uniref:EG45-like domain containing protein n=1 Tax=Pyrus x bretschneideri TaxID=225117 RepID=UPI00202E674F|nr:EG45-like domain containing protein [Pyrus x bretschneideri]
MKELMNKKRTWRRDSHNMLIFVTISFIASKTLKIKGPIKTMAAPSTTSSKTLMLMVLSFFCTELRLVSGDLGTATAYGPPYMPTKCFGSRPDQFPPMYLFVAVSEGLWDGGSACGRLYKIRCLSGPNMPCKGGATVEVKVVDHCRQSPCPSTIAMSTDAFAAISHSPSTQINIEFIQ